VAKRKQSTFRLTLSSNPRHIHKVEVFLKKVDTVAHLDEIQMHKVMVSLTEAVNNAIVHGNGANPEKRVAVLCRILPGWMLFQVADEGRGFDPSAVESPLREENLLRESGRGIFLMRTLMDKVEIEPSRKGTEVRLWLETAK
jgi:serine/threonine-protein kinase RsbW